MGQMLIIFNRFVDKLWMYTMERQKTSKKLFNGNLLVVKIKFGLLKKFDHSFS